MGGAPWLNPIRYFFHRSYDAVAERPRDRKTSGRTIVGAGDTVLSSRYVE